MRKEDAVNSAIIGFLVAALVLVLRATGNIPRLSQIPYASMLAIALPLLSVLGILAAFYVNRIIRVALQGARFLLVGGLNTFIDLTVLNILIALSKESAGVWFTVFKAMSFLTAVVNSYLWNKYWTFEEQQTQKKNGRELAEFLLVSGIGFGLNVLIASFVVNIIGPQFGISQTAWGSVGALAGTIVVLTWNFVGYKFVVFKK